MHKKQLRAKLSAFAIIFFSLVLEHALSQYHTFSTINGCVWVQVYELLGDRHPALFMADDGRIIPETPTIWGWNSHVNLVA